jgi:hypothetical protein
LLGFRIVREKTLANLVNDVETLKSSLTQSQLANGELRAKLDVIDELEASRGRRRIFELEGKVHDLSRRLESRCFEALGRGAIVVSRPFN